MQLMRLPFLAFCLSVFRSPAEGLVPLLSHTNPRYRIDQSCRAHRSEQFLAHINPYKIPVIINEPKSDADGTVIIVPGKGEPASNYADLIERLLQYGIRVVSYDQPGQGNCPEHQEGTAQYQDFVSTLRAVHRLIKQQYPADKIAYYAHSTGAQLPAQLTPNLFDFPPEVAVVVYSNPWILLAPTKDPTQIQKLMIWVFAKIMPSFKLQRFLTAGLYHGAVKAGQNWLAYTNNKEFDSPQKQPITAFVISDNDPTTCAKTNEEVAERMGAKRFIAQSNQHELHASNEEQAIETMRKIVEFISNSFKT